MLNFKQQELSENLYNALKVRFPDIELVEILESPFGEADIWIRVVPPVDKEKRSEFSHIAAEMTTDILVDYGYGIAITYAREPSATH